MLKVRSGDKKLIGTKYIDLFCGIGGFHLALSSYGAECVFASEIDMKTATIYQRKVISSKIYSI